VGRKQGGSVNEKQYEDRPGDVAAFPVKQKKNPKGPDYTGYHITLDGVRMRVALWQRANGMLSGKVEEERDRPPQGSSTPSSRRDDIPF
jgi:hypothetical protein